MASRNIRPRVLAAVSQLEAFTVPDLVQAAGLPNRKVAYAQLRKLSEEELLDEELLPPVGNHRPLTLYRLKSDSSVRERLAAELAGYHPPAKVRPSTGLAETAVAEANLALSKIETAVNAVARGALDYSSLEGLDSLLDSARIDIGTALLEYGNTVSQERTPAHPAIVARSRWRRLDEKLKKLRTDSDVRLHVQPWLRDVLTVAASALVSHGFEFSSTMAAALTQQMVSRITTLRKTARPAAEILMDEIRAEKDHPWVPLLRSACRLSDADLLQQVLALVQVGEPWVAYDNESTHYLLTKNLRTKKWLTAFSSLRNRLSEGTASERPKKTRPGLYSFEYSQLDADKYMELTQNCLVSVVTNTEVPFLGIAEMVRPTLAMDRGQTIEALDCEFLQPDDFLYAYGPLIYDLHSLPGAPSLRVACCLGMWGVPLQKCLNAIVETFENHRSLLVVQPEEDLRTPLNINEHVKEVLDMEVILAA